MLPIWELPLWSPQISWWIKSKSSANEIEKQEKDKCVCLAKGQISQTCCESKNIFGMFFDNFWRGADEGCLRGAIDIVYKVWILARFEIVQPIILLI